jgi:uncharacterized membrane protein
MAKPTLKLADLAADKMAAFAGTWSFIILVLAGIVLWTQLAEFDKYPFILLNLMLSCIAALEAPFILMAQRRQEDKDRARDEEMFRMIKRIFKEVKDLNEEEEK